MSDEQKDEFKFWLDGANHDNLTAKRMFASGYYDWALFVNHLAIEKLLKAVITKSGQHPLYSHDLNKLAKQAKLTLSPDFRIWLEEITRFNIAARYSKEKQAFYKKATKEYTQEWHKKCREIYQWIEQQP